MKVLLKKSEAHEPFLFRFTDDEGKILLKSENYKARASALNGIDSVKKNASSEKRYERKTAKNGKAYFNLKATNGQIIGTSPMFDDDLKRQDVIDLLSSSAASAELDDQSKASTAKVDTVSKTPKPNSATVKSKKTMKVTKSTTKASTTLSTKTKDTERKVLTAKDEPEAVPKGTQKKVAVRSESAQKGKEESLDTMMTDLAQEQLESTTDTIVSALNTLNNQLEQARENGSVRGKEIVKGLGGDSKMMKVIEDLAGYMGEAAGAGMTMGATPMIVMAGTAKGIYKKVTE